MKHPHEVLFAQLAQAMSAPRTPVRVDLGPAADAQHAQSDRLEFLPGTLASIPRQFSLPGRVSGRDQGIAYRCKIYGSSYDRMLELHRLLDAALDLLIGPPHGSAPSDDARRAMLTGTVDIADPGFHFSSLNNGRADLSSDGLLRSLALPGSTLAGPQALVDTLNVASNAIGNTGFNAHFWLLVLGAQTFLAVYAMTDPIDPAGRAAALVLDPTPSGSIWAALGFSSIAGNMSAVGAPPSKRYQPGYRIGESSEPKGGDAASWGWGVEVPVLLYTPIETIRYLAGTTQTVSIEASATGGAGADETLTNPGS